MSPIAEIVAFVRLAKGGLSTETLAAAIRRRWPDATKDDIREAIDRAAAAVPNDEAERAALTAAASAILGKPRGSEG